MKFLSNLFTKKVSLLAEQCECGECTFYYTTVNGMELANSRFKDEKQARLVYDKLIENKGKSYKVIESKII